MLINLASLYQANHQYPQVFGVSTALSTINAHSTI